MKKIIPLLFILALVPVLVFAGLVPCGNKDDDPDTLNVRENDPCTFCHLFMLFDALIDFALLTLLPILVLLRFLIISGRLLLSGGNPMVLAQVSKEFTNTLIVILLIFASWVVVNTVLGLIGLSGNDLGLGIQEIFLLNRDYWQVDCSITP